MKQDLQEITDQHDAGTESIDGTRGLVCDGHRQTQRAATSCKEESFDADVLSFEELTDTSTLPANGTAGPKTNFIAQLRAKHSQAKPLHDLAKGTPAIEPEQFWEIVEPVNPEAGSLAPASNLPVPRKRPSSETSVQQIRSGLGIVAKTMPAPTYELSPTQEEDLKAEIVRSWKQHQHCEKTLAPLLYKLCAALYAPGRKGEGFRAWLKSNHIPHATAYRWIDKYARREGLPSPYEKEEIQKPKRGAEAPTSSQVRQPSSIGAQSAGEEVSPAEFIAAPESLADVERLVALFLNGLSPSDRQAQAQELVTWLQTEFLAPPSPLSISEVAGD